MVDGTKKITDPVTLALYRDFLPAYTSISKAYCSCSRLLNAGAVFQVRLTL